MRRDFKESIAMTEAMPQVTGGELMMSNTLVVHPDHREGYLDELRKVLPLARRLDGCMFLEVGEIVESPGTFVLTERWRNGAEYVNEYLALPFYQEYLRNTEQMYAAPRDVVVLVAVS
jgi:quinol monooxygenase YgiN